MPDNNIAIKNMYYMLKFDQIVDVYNQCPTYPFEKDVEDLLTFSLVNQRKNKEYLKNRAGLDKSTRDKLIVFFIESYVLDKIHFSETIKSHDSATTSAIWAEFYDQVSEDLGEDCKNPLVLQLLCEEQVPTLTEQDAALNEYYLLVKAAYCLVNYHSWIKKDHFFAWGSRASLDAIKKKKLKKLKIKNNHND